MKNPLFIHNFILNKSAKTKITLYGILGLSIILSIYIIFYVVPFVKAISYTNTTGGFSISAAGANQPTGITWDSSDNSFWIADLGGFVYHFNSAGVNQTDGFSISAAGANFPMGITWKSSDNSFWIVDSTDDFVYHFNSVGVNQTDGFSISAAGAIHSASITWDSSDNSFWIADLDDFVYHFDLAGVNQTDGFSTSAAGADSPMGITWKSSDNSFWIVDSTDDFVYHFNSVGVNQTDGFSISAAGADSSIGITWDSSDNSFWIVDLSDLFIYHFKNTIKPTITITNPANSTYATTTIPFNVTATDDGEISTCRYSFNIGAKNYSMTNYTATKWSATNSTMTQGHKTVTFYCNDTSDNINSTSRQFTISTCICPAINTNWNVSMSDYCVLSATCNLGTGNLTFYNTGNFTINAAFNLKKMQDPITNQIIWIGTSAKVLIG